MPTCRLPIPGVATTATRVLGLDEAGRGSLLGPLVVGGFCLEETRIEELVALGAKDSKALTAGARERIFAGLDTIGVPVHVALSPRTVDRAVARGRLNDLEADAFAGLIRELAPDVAYVDACDPNERRFGRRVARLAGGSTRVVARHHADRDVTVVGAASIVAKVQRDRAIAELREELGEEIGSGYPSDRKTIDFVRAYFAVGRPAPPWLRGSWATMERVKPHRPARTLDGFGPMTVEESLASLVDRFNRHAERTPAMEEELSGLSRTIQIRLTDSGVYAVDLTQGRLRNLRSGPAHGADVRITTDVGTFHALVRKELGPMKALVTRRLSIEGSLEDKLLFRKLL